MRSTFLFVAVCALALSAAVVEAKDKKPEDPKHCEVRRCSLM